jgi:hypothetical protein
MFPMLGAMARIGKAGRALEEYTLAIWPRVQKNEGLNFLKPTSLAASYTGPSFPKKKILKYKTKKKIKSCA